MLAGIVPAHPQQWPASYNADLQHAARPWLEGGESIGDAGWSADLAAIGGYLHARHRDLQQEWAGMLSLSGTWPTCPLSRPACFAPRPHDRSLPKRCIAIR